MSGREVGAGLGWRLGNATLSVRASDLVSQYRTGKTQHNVYLASELTIPL
jgi:hypothetical protein